MLCERLEWKDRFELSGQSLRVAIQGELGSNSHMAALELLSGETRELEIVPCAVSGIVFERLLDESLDGDGRRGVDAAVLPIENSLYGSVAEHYDLMLENPVRIFREGLLRIRFHLMAMPGVGFDELRRVLSHPVALAQCRRFLAAHRELEVVPFYDTAGSVKHLMESGQRETVGIAPELAAKQYGAQILQRGLEDHAENFTRFHVICRDEEELNRHTDIAPNKMTLAFSVEHHPGTLVEALQILSASGIDLTRIESRPVPGRPWEYVFYVEFRFTDVSCVETVLHALRERCRMVKELGRYRAA